MWSTVLFITSSFFTVILLVPPNTVSAYESVNGTQKCHLIVPGSPVTLTCEPEWKNPFFWYFGKDGVRYLPKSNAEIRATQMIFHGVQLSDAGRYSCRSVKDPLAESVYHLVTPIQTNQPSKWNKVGRLGTSVILDCDFTADPQPTIEWFIGNDHAELRKRTFHKVHITTNPKTDVPNSRLIVQSLDASDSNEYTCRASHIMCGIQTEQIIALRAQDSHILTNEESTDYGVPGVIVNPKSQKLVLKCNYTGEENKEKYEYVWYKDGESLVTGSKYKVKVEGTASTLTVGSTSADDAGNYSCKLNEAEHATLKVLMYPTMEHVERSKNQVQGDPLTILCKVRGFPTPVVTWNKDDRPLELEDRVEFSPIDGVKNAKLVIKDLQYEDKGKYTCQASIMNVTRTVDIIVRVKDKYAALWPFLGICAEVAILCTIIFIFERRRTKPEFEDDDDKKDNSSRK